MKTRGKREVGVNGRLLPRGGAGLRGALSISMLRRHFAILEKRERAQDRTGEHEGGASSKARVCDGIFLGLAPPKETVKKNLGGQADFQSGKQGTGKKKSRESKSKH